MERIGRFAVKGQRVLSWLMLAALAVLMVFCAAVPYAKAQGAALPAPGAPGAVADARYCGEPKRTSSGKIYRSRIELRAFAEVFPCPSTLKNLPSCPGWAIDHTIPLASGGCDSVANMTWLPDTIKSCAGRSCKDRWERQYHALPRQVVDGK